MTTKALRDLGLLGVLLVVLAAVIYRNLAGEPTASTPPPSKPPVRDVQGKSPAPRDGSVMDVKLDRLTPQADSYGAPKRDPFRFRPKPAPVVKAPPPQQVYTPLPQAVPIAPAPRPPQGDPPERLIKYSGYLVNGSGKPVAIMLYGLPNSLPVQLYGLEGDIIEGRYRLLRIEQNAIEVAELGGEGRRARISRP